MRKITEIIVHCTATKAGVKVTAAEVDKWHKKRGFVGIGYHYLVGLDGRVETGRAVEKMGAHCTGHNAQSIGVCYVGGLDSNGRPTDTRTQAQRDALCDLLRSLVIQYPAATIHGHNEFANKACPCFDAGKEYANI